MRLLGPLVLAPWLLLAAWAVPWAATAQSAGRRAATLEALTGSPIFFHGDEVAVRADLVGDGVLAYLVDGDDRVLALDLAPPPAGTRDRLEVIGTFYDVGRFEPDDPRAADLPFERLSLALLDKPWPGAGELPVLVAATARAVAGAPGVTLRTLALDPAAHLGERVTVTGRFRGRNLYGDLPAPPGRSRWDFVLASVDAAVWVTGKEPRGDGFELDVQARIDTGRWLEVAGRVSLHEGMTVIEAAEIALADPPDPPRRPAAPRAARQGPPPAVIFSAPLPDDTDVPRDTTVRIQFSRDMDPDSFRDRIVVSYAAGRTDGGALPAGGVAFDATYRARNRVLEIRFDEALDRLRTLDVRLLDGITAADGAPLPPWTLSFFVGG